MTALTAAERDLILAGARHLVVPGERFSVDASGNLWTTRLSPLVPAVRFEYHAPEPWEDATGPCPTCGGVHEWMQNWPGPNDLGRIKKVCPDCIDGRKRVALTVTCPRLDTHLNGDPGDEKCDEHCDDNCMVVFAHATVEVLLVVASSPATEVRRFVAAGHAGHYLADRDRNTVDELALDPLPVPGRDFVVLLDDVETIGEPI